MSDPLHPLTIWWSVLFALSMLARYEPDAWADLTDVNMSDAANAIEHLLDATLDVVPELGLAAINDSARQDQAEAVRRLQVNAHLTRVATRVGRSGAVQFPPGAAPPACPAPGRALHGGPRDGLPAVYRRRLMIQGIPGVRHCD
jgi:YaaC-like Protein